MFVCISILVVVSGTEVRVVVFGAGLFDLNHLI